MNALSQLRLVAMLEGISFLGLLLIAMPLKYAFDLPAAVRVAGSVHGLLFLWFVSALVRVSIECRWPIRRAVAAFGASLVPGGTFVLDRTLAREMRTMTER
jgi:integral membrane protein